MIEKLKRKSVEKMNMRKRDEKEYGREKAEGRN
jgi:hypothetical protein